MAHFLISFLALLVTRLLQRQTGQLIAALRSYEAIPVRHGVHRLCRPTQWDLMDPAVGATLNRSWATLPNIRTWHRDLIGNTKRPQPTTPEHQ